MNETFHPEFGVFASQEALDAFKVGAEMHERIDLRGLFNRQAQKELLIDRWCLTARILMIHSPELALTWPEITESEDAVTIRSRVIRKAT